MQPVIKALQKLNWSVRHKIGLAFVLLLICFIINGSISLLLLFNIKATQDKQDEILNNLARLERYEQSYKNEVSLYSDIIFITNVRFIRDTSRTSIAAELGKKAADLNSRDFEARFAKLYLTALDHFTELGNLVTGDDFIGAHNAWQKFTPDFEAITTLLGEWRKQLEIERSWWSNEVNNAILLSVVMISSVTIGSILLGLFLLFLIERVLVRPMKTLQQGLDNVAHGDLNQQIEIYNQDEVGKLAASFKMAVSTLQQVINGVQISESLRAVTSQLASVSKQQAAGSTEQVSALSQVIGAMEELGRTAGQIADSAVQVADLTSITLEQIERVAEAEDTTRKKADQMVIVVQTTLNGVERVGQQVEQFRRSMSELNVQAEAINKVVGLLGSISDEVHLLALNAAIEAAGAGEYGDRFRVVAHQIKQLASRSNQATQEARSIINGVQLSSRIALSQVEEGQAEVSVIIESNSKLRQSLQELEQSTSQVAHAVVNLLKLAEQVSEQAASIKLATQQQRTSSEQVIVSTRSAEEVADQTATATNQIASSSIQLETLTDQLSSVLKRVKLAA